MIYQVDGSIFIKIITVIVLAVKTESARILAFYPTASISHQVVFRPLTLELVARGHEVVVITADPMFTKEEAPNNLTEIDLHDISYKIWDYGQVEPGTLTGEKHKTYKTVSDAFTMLSKMLDTQLMSEPVQNLIRDKKQKFDLILGEGYLWVTMCLSHIFEAPGLLISSMGPMPMNLQMCGSPRNPIYHPTFIQQDVYDHSFIARVNELQIFSCMNSYFDNHDRLAGQTMKRAFGEDAPSINDIQDNVGNSMLLMNIHNVWDMNRPTAKNIVYVGGLQLMSENILAKDLKQYLDSSKNGIIYVSFGTNADAALFRPEKLEMLIKVFSKLPFDILWKWNRDVPPSQSPNMKFAKWLPQAAILKHPKVLLFITQGGLQSTDEAISGGVPLLCIPLLGDQWYNAQQIQKNGIGIQMDLESASEEIMTNHINALIHNDTYRNDVAKLRSIFYDQPQSSLERAIWWIEHVLRHGGSIHLRSPAANMHWFHYFEIELLVYFLILLVVVLFVIIYFSVFVFKQVLKPLLVTKEYFNTKNSKRKSNNLRS